MELLSAYIPMDRRQAMARGEELPDRTSGAALFADISGFTPLTEALVKTLGPRQAAQEIIRQLNRVYEALISEVHWYRGSVIGFVGDAITCWFDAGPELVGAQAGLRATACGMAMQQVMPSFATIDLPTGDPVSLAIKVAIATGPARRFLVGDPQIQHLDTVAGTTMQQMAAAEKQAQKGEVVLAPAAIAQLEGNVAVTEWRLKAETGEHFAVIDGLSEPVEPTPWLPLLPATLPEAQVRPWLLRPVYERLMAGQGHFQAEMRPAVALFLKFGELDYDRDEAAGQKLDNYICWVQQVLARYEGYLIQLTIGDKGSYFYAAFGAPLAHDDDPARAVAAALDLQRLPGELDFITAQIGLGWGQMRTGAYGSHSRRNYGVIGDETILAARLMTSARPGQILLNQRVADAVADKFQLAYLGPIPVKGRKEPVLISMVKGRRPPSLPGLVNRFADPLVGRDDELAQLEQILAVVLNGQEQFVWLEGVAGIGKSHLASEFAQRAIPLGVRAVLGACQSTSQDIAYYPWQQIFRALFALIDTPSEPLTTPQETVAQHDQIAQVKEIVNDMNPGWLIRLPLLGDLLGLPIPDNSTTVAFEPRFRQEARVALAVELLCTWAQAQPLLLLIEDAHWLDEASLELTWALSQAIINVPLFLVLIRRPLTQAEAEKRLWADLSRSPYSYHLSLDELSAQGLADLVSNRLQGKPSSLALSLIQNQAQGNPFYAEELVDVLRETNDLYCQTDGTWTLSEAAFNTLREANCLTKENGQWRLAEQAPLTAAELDLPDSIHGIVLSRLDRLPETHKATLKVASVIGPIFEFDVLLQAHPMQPGRPTLLAQIATLEERGFLRLEPAPRLTYIFRHNITQEVTCGTLLESQQRELHRAVGQALEDLKPEAVERLAYHYFHGRGRDKALFYLDKAARKTQHEYANETALNYYRQALTLEERWDWRREQVEILHISGRREEEEISLGQLEANPTAPVFEVEYLRGRYHETIGNYAEAQATVERALAASQTEGHLVDELRCLAQLGLISRRQGDYERAKVRYNQALALFQTDTTYPDGATQALAQAFNGLGTVYRQQGKFDQARTCYQRALAMSRMSGDQRGEAEVLNSLGVTALYQRNFAEALPHYQQSLDISRSMGDRAREGTSLFNLAQLHSEAGDYGQAQRYLSEALTIHQATDNLWEEINVWNSLGILYLELGDLPTAQNCLQRGLQLAQDIGDKVGQAYLLSNLGLVVRDQGDLATADQLLTDGLGNVLEQDDKYQLSFFLSYLGTVSLQAGHPQKAIERAKTALTLRQELGMRLNTTDDLATLAAAHLATDNIDEALAYTQQALIILDECSGEGPEFPQRDYFICHQVLAAMGQKERARDALQSAYNLIMGRAKKITDPALRQSFLEKVAVNREVVEAYEKQVNGA